MPASLRDELAGQLLKKGYIGQTAQKLTVPPITSERLQLIQDFLTGDLVEHRSSTESERRFLYEKHRNLFPLLQFLFEHEELTEDVLAKCIYRHHRHMMWVLRDLPELRHENVSDRFRTYLQKLYDTFIWNIAHDLSPLNCSVLKYVTQFQGSRYLLLAAQHIVNHQITKLQTPHNYIYRNDNPSGVIGRMAETTAFDVYTDQDRQTIIEQIRQLGSSNKTLFGENEPLPELHILLPIAKHYRALLCEAFGWGSAQPLISFIEKATNQTHEYFRGNQYGDVTNSPDAEFGVIDVAAARRVVELAGDELAGEILILFEQSKVSGFEQSKAFGANVAFLIQAVMGANRSVVEKKFKHHTQIAIKAYGLLPLAGDETVLDRYLALKQSAKDGQEFGQMRRATHAGAVQVALENLAQVVGYTDASRLEWAMEAQLADEVAPPGRQWTVDNYTLELEVEGVDVSIIIHKDDRRLKSVPKAVRVSDSYKEARATVDQLRAQISRLRSGFLERLISRGETLPCSDFEALLRLPVARDLCQRLIWKTDGVTGLLDADEMLLVDLERHEHPIGGEVSLAHSYDLFQANELAAWQREIVHRRIVQPIKQAYRELYILTPAERETCTYSNRFAGHVIDARVAARLFGSRGWRIETGDAVTPYKIIGDFRAVFELPDAWHYLGGDAPVTTDKIFFQDIKSIHPDNRHWRGDGDNWLPVVEVPPLVFSEVMRDADLIVSVGQREGEARISNETFEQRGNLVRVLLDDLGLPGVTVEGHFAHVAGKLARYRVHLGSAVIHIEPGNYLCIVPDRWGKKHDKLFLPFVDEKDSKISEVISKILFLLADDKIKDESILRQINRQN